MSNWRNQINTSVIPCTYSPQGLFLSTNRGYVVQKYNLPSSTYIPPYMTDSANNAWYYQRAARRDGDKAVPVTPITYLTKGFPGPYN